MIDALLIIAIVYLEFLAVAIPFYVFVKLFKVDSWLERLLERWE